MTEKSALRRAREARGLSRAEVARALGTTVHRYYHCEMPPLTDDLRLLRRAQEYLGVGEGEGTPGREAREEPRVWRCPVCHHEEEQPGSVDDVWHKCRDRGHKLVRLHPVVEDP